MTLLFDLTTLHHAAYLGGSSGAFARCLAVRLPQQIGSTQAMSQTGLRDLILRGEPGQLSESAPGPASMGMAEGRADGAGESGREAAKERAVVGVSAVSGIPPSRAKISDTISPRITRDACVSSSARGRARN